MTNSALWRRIRIFNFEFLILNFGHRLGRFDVSAYRVDGSLLAPESRPRKASIRAVKAFSRSRRDLDRIRVGAP